jgi:hypothetical protein
MSYGSDGGTASDEDGITSVRVSPRTRQILAAVTGELAGTDQALPLPTLLTRLRQRLPLVPAEVISAEIATAAGAGLLHIVDAAVTLPLGSTGTQTAAGQNRESSAVDVDRPLRGRRRRRERSAARP